MAFRPATLGTIFCFAAAVLLALASFGTPLLKSIVLFRANINTSAFSGILELGTLGYCITVGGTRTCSPVSVGYELDLSAILNTNLPEGVTIPTVVAKWITYVLILHVVACGLALGATLFGLLAHVREFAMSCFTTCFASMAAAVALIAFIFDMVLFFLARARINSLSGSSASIGTGTWLVLAAWVILFFSGCALTCGRRCYSARGSRDPETGARVPTHPSDSSKMDYAFADQARREALRAEEDRKAQQARNGTGFGSSNPNHLPGFQPYETQPLTGGAHGPDQWLDEDEDPGLAPMGHAHPSAYRDHPGMGQEGYPRAPASEASSYVRGGYGAGIGTRGGGGTMPGGYSDPRMGGSGAAGAGSVPPGLMRAPSSSEHHYASGQAAPGGYPPVREDAGYYQQDSYHDPYSSYPPQAPQPTPSPYNQPYQQQQQRVASPYDPASVYQSQSFAVAAAPTPSPASYAPQPVQHQQQQRQHSIPTSPSQAYPVADPRDAMRHGFVSPPPPQSATTPTGPAAHYHPDQQQYQHQYEPYQPPQQQPQQREAQLSYLQPDDDPYGGYREPSPAQVHRPEPHRLSGGDPYAAAGPSTSAGQGGLHEPPSYEMGAVGGGFPREKNLYQPS